MRKALQNTWKCHHLFNRRAASNQPYNAYPSAASKGADDQVDSWGLLSSLNSILQKCKLVSFEINLSHLVTCVLCFNTSPFFLKIRIPGESHPHSRWRSASRWDISPLPGMGMCLTGNTCPDREWEFTLPGMEMWLTRNLDETDRKWGCDSPRMHTGCTSEITTSMTLAEKFWFLKADFYFNPFSLGSNWILKPVHVIMNVPSIKCPVIDNYAKDGGPGEVWLLCSFYLEPLRTWIKIDDNKFAFSAHMALKLGRQTLKSYLKITSNFGFISHQIKKLVPQRIMVKTT